MKDWHVLLDKPSRKKVSNLYGLARAAKIPTIPAEIGGKSIGFSDGCFSTWVYRRGEQLTYKQAVKLLNDEVNKVSSYTVDALSGEVIK